MPAPLHCRPEAHRHFEAALDELDTPRGLLRAAVAVSEHELRGVHLDLIEGVLDRYAEEILSRVPGAASRTESHARDDALLAHTHQLLFDEVGYRGDRDDYSSTKNSYIPELIRTRLGIPVSLCIVYQSVCDRVGLAVRGVNAPYHFLASVRTGPPEASRDTLIDVFAGGRVVDVDEALDAIASARNAPPPTPEDALRIATHADWIARLIRNLVVIFDRTGRPNDVAAMIELARLLEQRTS